MTAPLVYGSLLLVLVLCEFQTSDGRVVEDYRDPPPKIGARCKVGGVWARRLPPRLSRPVVRDFAHKALQLPRNHPAAPRVDGEGVVEFHNKREIDEFSAKTGGRFKFNSSSQPDGTPPVKPRDTKPGAARHKARCYAAKRPA